MGQHAIVVGAGIAGLATALALRGVGWSVAVHERDTGPARGGTALGMWPEAMAALDELAVGERVRRSATHVRGASILDPCGHLLGRVPESRGVHLVPREQLLAALLDQLPAGEVRWGRPLVDPQHLPEADLVVGADGIHSVVRRRCWQSRVERPLGTVAFRGVVDRPVAAVTETWGTGALFGITPNGDGRTNWFACVRRGRLPSAGSTDVDTLRELFWSWHSGVREVLVHLDGTHIDRRELFDVSLPHRYVRGRVALVGDAAHAMAPNLGRGACESLVDAVALARSIDSEPDLVRGLRRYDRTRRPRARRLVRAARALNQLATAERLTGLRDGALTLVAAKG